ncbi:PKD domain-containing protein [Palaeococcus ferrophilus]|uniref:PKD domain-containing protein n=1 Tax=Palaeococcus ferrophilus TaxID=83868 RepID=UPI00064FFB57|nr:PKD domain-containing protein [Palaeococcus ferrophilus]
MERVQMISLIFVFLLFTAVPSAAYRWIDRNFEEGGLVALDEEIIIVDVRGKDIIASNGFRMEWPLASISDSVCAGDLIGSPAAEIVYASSKTGKIYIISSAERVIATYDITFKAGEDIECGDVDNDGYDEIVHARNDESVHIYSLEPRVVGGRKRLELLSEGSFPLPGFLAGDDIAVADINGDWRADILHLSQVYDSITVYSPDGGRLYSQRLYNTQDDPAVPIDVISGDSLSVMKRPEYRVIYSLSREPRKIVELTFLLGSQTQGKVFGGSIYYSPEEDSFSMGMRPRGGVDASFSKGDRVLVMMQYSRPMTWVLNDDLPLNALLIKKNASVYQVTSLYPHGLRPVSWAGFPETSGVLAASGDIDYTSVVVGRPVKRVLPLKSPPLFVLEAPPKDADVLNTSGTLYLEFNGSVKIRVPTDAEFTQGALEELLVTTSPHTKVLYIMPPFRRYTVGREKELNLSISAEDSDKALYVEALYEIYEFPILNPAEASYHNGELQHLVYYIPLEDPVPRVEDYDSPFHEVGDIRTYPTYNATPYFNFVNPHVNLSDGRSIPLYLSDQMIEGITIGEEPFEVEKDFKWSRVKATPRNIPLDIMRQTIFSPFFKLDAQGKVTLHYSGGIDDPSKQYTIAFIPGKYATSHVLVPANISVYNKTRTEYYWIGGVFFAINSTGDYYRSRSRSPLGFSYDTVINVNNPNLNIPPWLRGLYETSCSLKPKPAEGKAPLRTTIVTDVYAPFGVTKWAMDFGDGEVRTGIGNSYGNFTHEYRAGGEYTLNLTLRNVWNSTVSCSASVRVAPNKPPKARFEFSPEKPLTGQEVRFKDASTDDGDIVSWNWDFGDGETSSLRNPSHEYDLPGTYTVSLTVLDEGGYSSTYSKEITVEMPNYPPLADFTYSPEEPKAGEEVIFQDLSMDQDGSITSWSWDFGDGKGSSERNPRHVYSSPGTYEVLLVVEDNEGAADKIVKVITVAPGESSQTTTTAPTESPTPTLETRSETETGGTPTSTASESTPSKTTSPSGGGICGPGAVMFLAAVILLARRIGRGR